MFNVGPTELLVILILALIVFGPRRLPEIGKSVGKMLAEFRKASNDFKRTIEDEVEAERLRDLDTARAAPAPTATAAPPTATEAPPATTEAPHVEQPTPAAVSREEALPPPIEPK